MADATLEERVEVLESRQDSLQRLIEERLGQVAFREKRGWQSIVGTFQDDPAYEEAMRLGREWRSAYRDETDVGTA